MTQLPCKTCDGTGLAAMSIDITSRKEAGLARWQRRRPKSVNPDDIVSMIVHDTGSAIADVDTCTWVRGMQRYHQQSKGWSDEAYSFGVGKDGEIVSIRGLEWDHFAEGSTLLERQHRYHGAGGGWPTIYGNIPWYKDKYGRYAYDFARRSISVVCQVGLDDSTDGYTEVTSEMLKSLHDLRAWASAQLGRELWVDVHRAHRIKSCPGPGLASHAENGRIGPWPEGLVVTTDTERHELALEFLAATKPVR